MGGDDVAGLGRDLNAFRPFANRRAAAVEFSPTENTVVTALFFRRHLEKSRLEIRFIEFN